MGKERHGGDGSCGGGRSGWGKRDMEVMEGETWR